MGDLRLSGDPWRPSLSLCMKNVIYSWSFSPELRAARPKSRLHCPRAESTVSPSKTPLDRQILRFLNLNPRLHRLRPRFRHSSYIPLPSFTARAPIPLPEPAFHYLSPLLHRPSHCASATGRLCRRGRAFLTQIAYNCKIESVTPARMSLSQNGDPIWHWL